LESAGLSQEGDDWRRLTVLRAIDKMDRLAEEGVRELLGTGRKDESGDFTPGAQLSPSQIDLILFFTSGHKGSAVRLEDYRGKSLGDESTFELDGTTWVDSNAEFLTRWEDRVWQSETGRQGINELREMIALFDAAGYGTRRVRLDASVVRGLEYYTGPVFEAELTPPITDERGLPVRLGSVVSGGRYDGLVERFLGQKVPATGVSIGVSRLLSGLRLLGRVKKSRVEGPVVVAVFPSEPMEYFQRLVAKLRKPDDGGPPIRAEMYLGKGKQRDQFKYADKRGAPCVVIQGSDERERGKVAIKDLTEGSRLSRTFADHKSWQQTRPGQFEVPEEEFVIAVRNVLSRHQE
jgi:histidyl-tRNA synthetase